MFNITIAAKSPDDLKASVLDLATAMGLAAAPQKKLSDFPLQDIVEYVRDEGYQVDVAPIDVQPSPDLTEKDLADMKENARQHDKAQRAAKKAKAKPAETVSPEETVEPEKSPEELKDEAVKAIMAVYTKPEGKKITAELLKKFNTNNFHKVPEDRWVELHRETFAALSAAGL